MKVIVRTPAPSLFSGIKGMSMIDKYSEISGQEFASKLKDFVRLL